MDDRSACEVFVTHDMLATCCIAAYDLAEADTLEARQAASNVLAMLSGWTVFGTCTATVRPIGVICIDGRDAIPLTWPVRTIDSVWLDGVPLDLTQVALVDKRYLIRTDCLTWPCWQDLAKQRTELCTFEIVYSFGTDIPYQGVIGAAEIACEYLNGCGGGECKLPNTATSLSQQGMSLNLAGDEVIAGVGRGDLPLTKEFLAIFNPTGQMPTAVYSPDMPKLRVMEYPGTIS